MQQTLKNILLSASSAVIGGSIVLAGLKMSPTIRSKIEDGNLVNQPRANQPREEVLDDILNKQRSIDKNFDNLFEDDFLGAGHDPFDQMRQMREQMEKRMNRFGAGPKSNPFDSWFSNKFGGGTVSDIAQREDSDFVYYDVTVDDVNSTSINTKIDHGYITITGTTEKKPETGSDSENQSQSYFKSSFNRTFPLPDHVDPNKMQMSAEGNKIILKFPKVKVADRAHENNNAFGSI